MISGQWAVVSEKWTGGRFLINRLAPALVPGVSFLAFRPELFDISTVYAVQAVYTNNSMK
jgi:hypothetical protein